MNALILSHQKTLLPLLQDTLNPMSAMARVRRSGAAPLDAGEQARQQPPDLVFVDLAWCGISAAPALMRELRRTVRRAPLVLLVDRPEEVTLAQLAQVHADLYIGKSAAPRVMRRSLQRWFTPTGDLVEPHGKRLAAEEVPVPELATLEQLLPALARGVPVAVSHATH
jgi:DNA-binding response OmpR family regulator